MNVVKRTDKLFKYSNYMTLGLEKPLYINMPNRKITRIVRPEVALVQWVTGSKPPRNEVTNQTK